MIGITVLSLALCGATAANRQAAMADAIDEARADLPPMLTATITPDSPTDGEMVPDGIPNSEPLATISSTWLAPNSQKDIRERQFRLAESGLARIAVVDAFRTHISTSSSLISSKLGRQFTLVGAKPSGTS